MKVKDITRVLEEWAPKSYQENYDNCGLLVGSMEQEISMALVTLDVTEKVIEEAISDKAQMIIAHHPLIFGGINKVTDDHWVGRSIALAIKNDISIYAIHTNLDNIHTGVNRKIAEKLNLTEIKVLSPKSGSLIKLETFAPNEVSEKVLEALYEAGAGQIGNYKDCSFTSIGQGTFKPTEGSNPAIGEVDKPELVEEVKIEVILSKHSESSVLRALKSTHPYEEVAFYMSTLSNQNQQIGAGMIGQLKAPMTHSSFLKYLKERMNLNTVKHTIPLHREIKKVAVCGGAGSFLLKDAIQQNADIFISSDFKYHEFFEADEQINIADIGHYESEVFTKELIHDYLSQKFANIAFRLSGVNTNPVTFS